MINQKIIIFLLLNFSTILSGANPAIREKTIAELKNMFIVSPASLTDLELLRLNAALLSLDKAYHEHNIPLVRERPKLCSIL